MISVDLQKRAISMRIAGHSLATIAEKTGISVRCLKNIFARNDAAKGIVTAELVKKTKADLLDDAKFKTLVKESVNALLQTELSLTNQIIDSIAVTLEQLETAPPTKRASSLVALSNALQTASNIQRRTLGLDSKEIDIEDIPLMTIREMNDSEIADIQRKANLTDLELNDGA